MDVFGIDLGSSYSCLAVCNEDGTVAIRPNNGQNFMPSVVSYGKDRVIVGWSAQENLADPQYCSSTFSYVKRYMSKDFLEQKIENQDSRKVSPIEIQATILKKIIDDENYARKVENREPLTHGVITIPSRFGDTERNKIKAAAMLAGIADVELIHEPTAAAVAYLHQKSNSIYDGEKTLVFDLGGGTLDISILEYRKQENDYIVLRVGGISTLGGRDFDKHLLQLALQFEGSCLTELNYEHCKELWEDNLLKAEACKKRLSVNKESSIRINLPDGRTTPVTITQDQFMEYCQDLIEQIEPELKRTMDGMDINHFILSGGACQMPMMETYLNYIYKNICGLEKEIQIFEPEFAIAKGAAIIAKMFFEKNKGKLIDVGNKAYGLVVTRKETGKIEVRNFIKVEDRLEIEERKIALDVPPLNEKLNVRVYEHTSEGDYIEEGKMKNAKEIINKKLTPPLDAREGKIELIFSRDISGIVHVRAEYNGQPCRWDSPVGFNMDEKLVKTIMATLKIVK